MTLLSAPRAVTVRDVGAKLWVISIWTLLIFFVINLFGIIGAVLTSSFATRW